jgi:hypothetical protein
MRTSEFGGALPQKQKNRHGDTLNSQNTYTLGTRKG